MKCVYEHIEKKKQIFARHQFFEEINHIQSIDDMASMVQRLAFWVMSFQDLLQLNTQLVKDSKLSTITTDHLHEDSGHEQWFLEDLKTIAGEIPNIRVLFNSSNSPTRYASYALIAEVYYAKTDHQRIALLLLIESFAAVFFERTSKVSDSIGFSKKLKYFSFHHLEAEESHESLDVELEEYLDSALRLKPEDEEDVLAIIDRATQAFNLMFDSFEPIPTPQTVVTA